LGYRWANEADRPALRSMPDRVLHVEANEVTLLELVASPPARYELSAEVRHEAGERGRVGVYWAHREAVFNGGPAHWYTALAVADRGPEAGTGQLRLWHYRELGPNRRIEHDNVPLADAPLPAADAAGWRTLVARVTPDALSVSWAGGPFVAVGADDLRDGCVLRWRQCDAPPPAPGNPPPNRGGLGLYVCKGIASFANVVVRPLPE
jgi:hypothetical protein